MINCVVGFLFNEFLNRILLISKKRPEWMVGKLNGIGGHIESGETPLEAMHREFRQETGYPDSIAWFHFARLYTLRGYRVDMFCSCTTFESDFIVSPQPTDELVGWHLVSTLSLISTTLPSLHYLIPMATSFLIGNDNRICLEIHESAGDSWGES